MTHPTEQDDRYRESTRAAIQMLAHGTRRWADPHSVVAADLLRDRLRRKESLVRAIEAQHGHR